MANGQDPGTDVRPKKQYIAGFLDQATSATKLKLKHLAEANKRGFTITKVNGPCIGLLIKISNTKIVVKVPLEDICTQCYKENLFGDKTRRKKIEQAAAPYLRPLVHSDFYTSHPYIYPYIIPMCKLNTKIFYVETDWIDAELQLLLGMQVRRPEGSQDPRLKISDVSRWTCCAESLSVIACSNMATANWLKSFEEKDEGVLMSVMAPADLACGLLYAFHKLYNEGGEDMPKPKGEGDVIVVLPVPTVFFLTTSKNYAGLCYVGKEVLSFVDDPEVVTTKAMRMTEYADEKGEKSQRFRLYRPNVTSEEGSVPENAEQLALLSDALENIRREKDRKNAPATEEVKEEVCETCDDEEQKRLLDELKTTHQELQDLEQQKAKLRKKVKMILAQDNQTNEAKETLTLEEIETLKAELHEELPKDEYQVFSQVTKLLGPNMTESENSESSSDGDKTRPSSEEYYDASEGTNGYTVDLDSTRNTFPEKNDARNNCAQYLKQADTTSDEKRIKSITDLPSGQGDTQAQTAKNRLEGSTERGGVSELVHAFEKMSITNQGHAYAARRGSTPSVHVAVVPPIPRELNDSDLNNRSANGEPLDSSFSSEEDTTVRSWLKRCCSTPKAGRGRARGRVERTTTPSIGVDRSSLGSSKSRSNVSVLPFVRSPQDNVSFSNGSLVSNDGVNTSQCSTNEREDSGASGWGSWLGKRWPGKVKKQVLSFFGVKNEDTPKDGADLTVAIGIAEELDLHNASIIQSTPASLFTSTTISESPRAPSTVDTTESPSASGGLSAGSLSLEIRHSLDGTVDVVYSEDKRHQLLNGTGNTKKRYRIEPDPIIPQSTDKADMSLEIRHCVDGTVDVVYSEDKRHQLLNGTGNTQKRYRIDPNPDKTPSSNAVETQNGPPSTERPDSPRQKGYTTDKKRDKQGAFEFPPIRKIADFQNGGIASTEPLSKAIAASLATKWPSVKNALLDDDIKTGATGGVDLFLQPTSKTEQNKAQRLSQDLTKWVESHGGARGDGGVAKNKKTKETAPRKVKTVKKKRSTRIPVFLSAKEAGVTEEATRIASEIAEEKPIKTTLCAKLCFQCGALKSAGGAAKLRRCNGCGVAMYCSRACQEKHRRQHRPTCKTLVCNKDKFAVYVQL